MMRRDLLGAVAAAAMLVTGAAFAAEVSQTAPVAGGRTELAQASQQSNARVRVKSAVLRTSPDAKSRKLGSLRRGTRIQVLDASGEWSHVRVRNQDGYILTSLLTM
jgi:hypothetical protein